MAPVEARIWISLVAAALGSALLSCDAGAGPGAGPVAAPPSPSPLVRSEEGAAGAGGTTGAGGAAGVGDAGGECVQKCPLCDCNQICRKLPCPEHCRPPSDTIEECLCPQTFSCLDAPPHCNVDEDCRGDVPSCVEGVCACESNEDCGPQGYRCGGEGLCVPFHCETSRDCCAADGRCLTCRADGVCGEPLAAGTEPTFSCAQGAPAGRGSHGGALVALALTVAALRRHRTALREASPSRAEPLGTPSLPRQCATHSTS